MKHTKGEWRITNDVPNGYGILKGDIEIHDGVFSVAAVFNDIGDSERAEANAKLIAAAPDLLEALIKVKTDLKKHWNSFEWNEFDELTGVDNAINKATL